MIRRTFAVLAAVAAILALDPHHVRAAPDAPATASAGASAAAPVASASSFAGAPALPPFDAEPFPPDATPAPKADEWRAATPVSLTRNFTPCRAYRVREWMKVNCSHLAGAGIAQITGPTKGVALSIGHGDAKDALAKRNMEIIFPLRRGTGHMFQLLEIGEGYDGPSGASVALILGDSWAPGEAPIITLH